MTQLEKQDHGEKGWNSCHALWEFLKHRSSAPKGHFTFYAFFAVAICGVGAFGLWEWLVGLARGTRLDLSGLIGAMCSYFPAIAVASAFEMLLIEDRKYVRSFATVCLALVFVLALLCVLIPPGRSAIFVGAIGCGVSIGVWWIANGENAALLDQPPKRAAIGDDVSMILTGDDPDFNS